MNSEERGALRRAVDRALAPLPSGTLPVGAGLVVGGITAYGFLVISGRALGPERYASLSVLWALVFLAGPGLFLPVEQEVARALAARRARGVGGGPVVRRALGAAVIMAAALVAGAIAGTPLLLEHLFDDQVLLVVGLVFGLIGYAGEHLARGTLSGNDRFRPYGLLIGSEGVFRLAGCVALATLGVATAGPYGLAIGVAPFLAIAIALAGRRGLSLPGPKAPWSELSTNLGYLLAGSLLAQSLMNAGPLAVKLLAPPAQQAAAGRFLAGLVIARIPVFFFQAVQAALLPKLSGLAAAGRHGAFRLGLRRLLIVVGVIGIGATAGAFAVGPWVVRTLFGADFVLERRDLTYLAGASAFYMVALSLAQALIALRGHARAALGWASGVLVFLGVLAFTPGLLLRVERGFLAGAMASAAVMAIILLPRLEAAEATPEDLVGAAHDIPIEP